MTTYIGSARHDEYGKLSGGKIGDQLQSSSIINDVGGEVSLQPMYTHSKGWYIFRPKSIEDASKIASMMLVACNNKNIGYSQNTPRRLYNVATNKGINVDCSILVRSCIYNATGIDVGNFTTADEIKALRKSGLFLPHIQYISQSITPVYVGDILLTTYKGHTAIVVFGETRKNDNSSTNIYTYYPTPKMNYGSIVTALKSVGEKDTSFSHRILIAKANNITNYKGTASQNLTLLKLLNAGKLKKV